MKIPINQTISQLNKKKIKLFLPTSAFNNHNFKNEIFYFNNTKSKLSRNNNNITKSNDFNASGLKALLACVHLGYDEILICGLDNNFWNNIKVNSKNEILHLKSHFYEDKDYIKHKSFKLISDVFMSIYDHFMNRLAMVTTWFLLSLLTLNWLSSAFWG